MFDKNSSFNPSNKPNNQHQDAPNPADEKVDDNKKAQSEEDIFSQADGEKTGAITEEQKKMAAKVLSPDIVSDDTSLANHNIENSNKASEKSPKKSNKKMLLTTLILFLILLLSVTAIWYYVNYIQEGPSDVDNISENAVLNKNQNDNSNTNEKSLADIVKADAENRKNQNINENIPLPPSRLDSDFDGLSDEEENELGTNIHMADTDSDGLLDKEEVMIYNTNPLIADTDGDGFTDGDEIKNGYNPNGDGKFSLPPVIKTGE